MKPLANDTPGPVLDGAAVLGRNLRHRTRRPLERRVLTERRPRHCSGGVPKPDPAARPTGARVFPRQRGALLHGPWPGACHLLRLLKNAR